MIIRSGDGFAATHVQSAADPDHGVRTIGGRADFAHPIVKKMRSRTAYDLCNPSIMEPTVEIEVADRRKPAEPRKGDAAAAVLRLIEDMDQLYELIVHRPRAERSLRTAALNLTIQAPRMVRSFARGFAQYKDQLPEIEENPEELLAQQDDADLLKLLRAHAYLFFVDVNAAYVDTQSQPVGRVRAALRRLRASCRHLYRLGDPRRLIREALIARVAAFDPKTPQARNPRRRAPSLRPRRNTETK